MHLENKVSAIERTKEEKDAEFVEIKKRYEEKQKELAQEVSYYYD